MEERGRLCYKTVHHRHRLETIHTGISMADTVTMGLMKPVNRHVSTRARMSRSAIAAIHSFLVVLLFVFVAVVPEDKCSHNRAKSKDDTRKCVILAFCVMLPC